MQVSVENVSALGRKLTLKIPTKRLDSQINERIVHLGRTVRLHGFRPGRVPPQIIRQRFGEQVRGEILSDLVNEGLREAFDSEKLHPVTQPTIDSVGEPENGEIACTASFEVMPEFPDIVVDELEVERPVAEVTDADVDAMIETLRKQRRQFNAVERASQEGDFVIFEYAAQAGDARVPVEGLERAGTILGDGGPWSVLDGVLTGRAVGDNVKQDVTFPADFRIKDLAGHDAAVEVNVIKVQEAKLPELDAAFLAQFGVADGDMDAFREEVRGNLERELKSVLGVRLKDEVAAKLADAYADLDVPQAMVDAEVRAIVQGQVRQGEEPSAEALEAARPEARRRVAAALLMGEIARAQKLELDRSRVAELMAAIASTYEEPEKVIEMYNGDSQLMAGLQNRVMESQVAEWVADNAKTTDKPLSFDAVMRPGQA